MKKLLCSLFLLPVLALGQQTGFLDVTRIEAVVEFDTSQKEVHGKLHLEFRIKQAVDSVFLDAHNMTLNETASNGIEITPTSDKIWFKHDFKPMTDYVVDLHFHAQPKQTLYFIQDQVWTQGQGKYTSHWLPSLDDMNDKIEFDLTVIAHRDYRVVANGTLVDLNSLETGNVWRFNMDAPMSSYLVAIAMGNFVKEERQSSSGIPIELYLDQSDADKFEPTFRYTEQIFDFFEQEIGIDYPWKVYKQVAVKDFLYAGMENTSLTLFSDAFVVDSIGYNDRNYVNVNAHELAHHWFGNLITETSGTHHWLQEGFATYYAYLAERELFGDAHFYNRLYETAEQLRQQSEAGNGQALLDPKASSLTFYEKGAWALHSLREAMGADAFRLAVKRYLAKHAFGNVATDDFLEEVAIADPELDVEAWRKQWLVQTAFPIEETYNLLVQNEDMQILFGIQAYRNEPMNEKLEQLLSVVKNGSHLQAEEAIFQAYELPMEQVEPLIVAGLTHPHWSVRQAVAGIVADIPEQLRPQFEALLEDDSYLTREMVLLNLWTKFPEHRARYLDATKEVQGFHNKNIRLMWLVLALYTDGYNPSAKVIYAGELASYSSDFYGMEVRQTAFQYMMEMGFVKGPVLDNLLHACTHHQWRFRDFARELLDEALKDEQKRTYLVGNRSKYPEKQQEYLDRALNK